MNIFTKQNWFTCTSITSRKIITLKIPPVLKLLAQDSHTEPIFCFDWIPIVVFDNPEEDDCSNTVDASSARLDSATVRNTPHKMTFLYRYSLKFFKKKPSRRSNLQKTETYQGFFVLKLREITVTFVDRSKAGSNEDILMVMTTDQLL